MQKQGLVQVCLNDTFCLILGQHNLASSFLFFSPPSQFLMHTRRHTHVSAKTVINFYQWQLPIGKIGLPTQRHHALIINKLQIKKGLAVCLTHAITVHQSKESEHSLTVFLLRQVYIFTLKLNCWLQHYDIIQKGCATVKILLLVYRKMMTWWHHPAGCRRVMSIKPLPTFLRSHKVWWRCESSFTTGSYSFFLNLEETWGEESRLGKQVIMLLKTEPAAVLFSDLGAS